MGFWGDVLEVGTEVGTLGVEAFDALGSATPLLGTGINAGKGIYHGTKAHDAEMEGDQEKADHYGSEAAYDWLKAIPGVGTCLGVGELASGVTSAAQGDGFVHGMDNFKDTTKDLGAMLGITEFGGSRYDGDPRALAHLGAHAERREVIEGRDTILEDEVRRRNAMMERP